MFQIRKEQRQALEEAALPGFEDYMVEHLMCFASRHCEILGEPVVREVIRLGVQNAKTYGFTRPGPLRLHIELMFILGSGFDTDPQLPWAVRVLADSAMADQSGRADRLYEASLDYHANVVGADSEYAVSALRRVHQEASALYAMSGNGFTEQILGAMQEIYPQKYASTEESVLRSLVPRAHELAKSVSATTDRAIALFVTSMFAFGHGFDRDPLYPWISGTLRNTKAIKDPNARVDRLFEKTMTYIGHMLDYFEES